MSLTSVLWVTLGHAVNRWGKTQSHWGDLSVSNTARDREESVKFWDLEHENTCVHKYVIFKYEGILISSFVQVNILLSYMPSPTCHFLI